MTLENQDIIHKSKNPLDAYPLIFVGAVIAVRSMPKLMSRGFAGSFPRSGTFFHYIRGAFNM